MHHANSTPTPCWTLQFSDDPIVATAIHDGHGLRRDVADTMLLTHAQRLREEDPFTGQAIAVDGGQVLPESLDALAT